MQRMANVLLLALGATLVFAGEAVSAEGQAWKAGVARVVITPQQLMWMSGYAARDRPAEGKLHDLWAKALVLEDADGKRVVLVTLDLVGIPRSLSLQVTGEIERRHRFKREAIMLACSHTHCGPVVKGNLDTMYFYDEKQQQLVSEYANELRDKIIRVVGDALMDLGPAEVAWATGKSGFAVNRRNNKEADVPRLREEKVLRGPVDHDVPVLAVRKEGKLRSIVFGYACHATVLSFYQWSGDYPGFAQIALEKAHPDAVALFWAGCGGDQNPLPRRTVALAEMYGNELAQSVNAVLAGKMEPLSPRLASTYAEIPLPFAGLPSRDQLLRDSELDNKYEAARAKRLLAQLMDEGLPETYPYPLQVWRLGDKLTWVALGGEVVVDYSLRLKKELGPSSTWVAGYCNDVMAYIPSLRVLREGGYEGATSMIYYGQPTVWGPRIEEIIVAEVHAQARKVRAP
jgi:hypothetical protein